jgi:hypothetical protein
MFAIEDGRDSKREAPIAELERPLETSVCQDRFGVRLSRYNALELWKRASSTISTASGSVRSP